MGRVKTRRRHPRLRKSITVMSSKQFFFFRVEWTLLRWEDRRRIVYNFEMIHSTAARDDSETINVRRVIRVSLSHWYSSLCCYLIFFFAVRTRTAQEKNSKLLWTCLMMNWHSRLSFDSMLSVVFFDCHLVNARNGRPVCMISRRSHTEKSVDDDDCHSSGRLERWTRGRASTKKICEMKRLLSERKIGSSDIAK